MAADLLEAHQPTSSEQLAALLNQPEYHQYASSHWVMLPLGRYAAEEFASEDMHHALAVLELAYNDMLTALGENFATAPEMRANLDVNRSHEFAISDGQVVASDGTPMATITRRGLAESETEIEAGNEYFAFQAIRDAGDILTADEVDKLQPGQMRMVISMAPADALAAYPDEYHRLGYLEDLSFIQVYYCMPNGKTMLACSFSVQGSDPDIWRSIQEGLGVTIPKDVTADTWIQHAFTAPVPPEFAREFPLTLRKQYYDMAHAQSERLDTNAYVAGSVDVVNKYFNSYVIPVAEAIYTGRNRAELQQFATALLDSSAIDRLPPSVREQLEEIAQAETFSPTAGSLLMDMIRYGLAEALRTGLEEMIAGGQAPTPDQIAALVERASINALVADINRGVAAGHQYYGCSKAFELMDGGESDGRKRQDNYGGLGEWKRMTCPFCGDSNQYGDPCSPNQYCTNCKARVAGGKVVSTGDGGNKKKEEKDNKLVGMFAELLLVNMRPKVV